MLFRTNISATKDWDDFQGVRLDWIRLQTYLCDVPPDKRGFFGLGGGMNTPNHYGKMQEIPSRMAKAMFNIAFSSKMIDYLDNVLNQVSDMSIFL